MNKEEAKAWTKATERSLHEWRVDEIHNTVDDSIIFKGGMTGHFVTTRHRRSGGKCKQHWLLEIGTYIGAYPHIGEACFTVLGRKPFISTGEMVKFISQKITLISVESNGVLTMPLTSLQELSETIDSQINQDEEETWNL